MTTYYFHIPTREDYPSEPDVCVCGDAIAEDKVLYCEVCQSDTDLCRTHNAPRKPARTAICFDCREAMDVCNCDPFAVRSAAA